MNNRIAAQLRGEDPGPWPFGEDWATCPDCERDKTKVIEGIKSSTEAILSAMENVSDEKFTERFKVGEHETSCADRVGLAGMHMMYHCAQLNYIQGLHGDDEMHWM